jgi:HK97 gp10 family phage protein
VDSKEGGRQVAPLGGIMRVRVQIEGMDELINDIKKMQDKGKSVLDAVAMAGANYAKGPVQSAIPVSSEDGKHLRDNTKPKKMRKKNPLKSSALLDVGGSKTPYGFNLETGHMTKKGKHVPANPFMRSTIDKESENIGRVMGEEFIKRVGV